MLITHSSRGISRRQSPNPVPLFPHGSVRKLQRYVMIYHHDDRRHGRGRGEAEEEEKEEDTSCIFHAETLV